MRERLEVYLAGRLHKIGGLISGGLNEAVKIIQEGPRANPFSGTIDVQHGLEPQPKPSKKSQA